MANKPIQFSPSSLSLHKECPRCFWLAFNEKIKRPKTPFPSLPNGMDDVLKTFYDSHIPKNKLPKEMKHLTKLKLYPNKSNLATWRNNFVGIRTTDTEGNTIMGAIDTLLLDSDTNEIIVLDFKTRSSPPNGNSYTYYVDQLSIYTWLLKQQGLKVANYAYLIFYYPKSIIDSGVCLFESELVKVDVEIERVPAILAKANHCLQNPIPASSPKCEFCNWRKKQDNLNTQTKLSF